MSTYTAIKTKFETLSEEPKGIVIMFVASFFFSFMGYFIKILSRHHTTFEIVFFRNLVSFAVLGSTMLVYKPVSKGGKPLLLIMRGIFGFGAMFCFFYSISVLPLATATTFSRISPIFTAIFAGFVLKENVSPKVWIAVMIGFAGVLMILKPSGEMSFSGAIVGLCGGVIAAMSFTSVKGLAKYYDARIIVLSLSAAGLTGSILYFIIKIIMGDQRYISISFIPTGADIYYVIAVGFLAAIAQWLMSVSYQYGRASVVTTVSYAVLIFSTILGFIAGDGWPGGFALWGIFLIGLSGIMVGINNKAR